MAGEQMAGELIFAVRKVLRAEVPAEHHQSQPPTARGQPVGKGERLGQDRPATHALDDNHLAPRQPLGDGLVIGGMPR